MYNLHNYLQKHSSPEILEELGEISQFMFYPEDKLPGRTMMEDIARNAKCQTLMHNIARTLKFLMSECKTHNSTKIVIRDTIFTEDIPGVRYTSDVNYRYTVFSADSESDTMIFSNPEYVIGIIPIIPENEIHLYCSINNEAKILGL